MMRISGFTVLIFRKIRQGANSLLKLILRNSGTGNNVMPDVTTRLVPELLATMLTSKPAFANVGPIFSNMRVSSTGLSTEARRTLLFISFDKCDFYSL